MQHFLNSEQPKLILGLKVGLLVIGWLVLEYYNLIDQSQFSRIVVSNLVYLSRSILEILGYEAFVNADMIGIAHTSGVQIGPPCNAVDLMLLFSSVLVILPGFSFTKLIYWIICIFLIHIVNLLRVIALIFLVKYNPSALEFNHTYTFTIVLYLFIFGMWIGWNRIFQSVKKPSDEN